MCVCVYMFVRAQVCKCECRPEVSMGWFSLLLSTLFSETGSPSEPGGPCQLDWLARSPRDLPVCLQCCSPTPTLSLAWVPGIHTQVVRLAQQVLHPLSCPAARC